MQESYKLLVTRTETKQKLNAKIRSKPKLLNKNAICHLKAIVGLELRIKEDLYRKVKQTVDLKLIWIKYIHS